MGSNGASVGNLAGKNYFEFTAANQDSGPLGFNEIPPFYKARTIQIIGAGTGYSIQIFGTLDKDTCEGTAQWWEPIPAPSSETTPQWSNPLTDAPGTRLFYTNAPFAAIRALSGDTGSETGVIAILVLAAS